MGFIFTLLGIYTAWRFAEVDMMLTILTLALTGFQISSLCWLYKIKASTVKEKKLPFTLNVISVLSIVIFFIFTFYC